MFIIICLVRSFFENKSSNKYLLRMWEYVGSVELWSHSVELSQRAHIIEN